MEPRCTRDIVYAEACMQPLSVGSGCCGQPDAVVVGFMQSIVFGSCVQDDSPAQPVHMCDRGGMTPVPVR